MLETVLWADTAAAKVVAVRTPLWWLAVVDRHGSNPCEGFDFDPGLVETRTPRRAIYKGPYGNVLRNRE